MLARDTGASSTKRYEYRVLATKKTSTMQKELGEAAEGGYQFVGMTVADTACLGREWERPAAPGSPVGPRRANPVR